MDDDGNGEDDDVDADDDDAGDDDDEDDCRVGKCDSDHWNPILGIRLTLTERGCRQRTCNECSGKNEKDALHKKDMIKRIIR